MQYTRQEVVRMLRKAGFREIAEEAIRDLPDRLISIMSRSGGDSTASPETFSPARWAAAHDAVRLGPANQAAAPRELGRIPQPDATATDC